MTAGRTALLTVAGSGEQLRLCPDRLVVAGYTARVEVSVARHIEELAAIGVPEPPTVPMFYELDPALLTTDSRIEVAGTATSGEVEPVLIRHRGSYFLGVGSDHTDRALERQDIAAAKAACPKPLASTVFEIGRNLSFPAWEQLEARSDVDGNPYQSGSVAALRHPAELLDRMTSTLPDASGDLVVFCGTLALLSGEFVPGDTWSLSLQLAGAVQLNHTYTTAVR